MSKLLFGLMMASVVATSQATEAEQPLTPGELAKCAVQVQQLRAESARLNQQAAANNIRRDELAAMLNTQNKPVDDLISYNRQASAFNQTMVDFRQEVAEINTVKQNYDAQCANRSYRRSELNALPPEQANAMRTGLADVRVPQTQAVAQPLQQK